MTNCQPQTTTTYSTILALDAHCCSKDDYADGADDEEPTGTAVLPACALPLAVDHVNAATSCGLPLTGADSIRPFSYPLHKVAKSVNCDGTFVNSVALAEHHKECLIGSSVACYAGTTTPITMCCPDTDEFLCMVCDIEVNLAAVSTHKLIPKVVCSSNCQVQCQHESEAVLRDFQRMDALDSEDAK